MEKMELFLEKVIFAGRWLLAPLYIGLLLALLPILYRFFHAFWHMMTHVQDATTGEITLQVLELLDTVLLGNLIIIVLFAGYENFVSKITIAEGAKDRPHWMGHVDYSGLKIKLIGSLVAMVARYEASINYEGIDIRGAQPSRGNIEGGLSTLEEKSLGAAKKAGNAPLTGVLEFGEKPQTPGLYFMDTPGHDIEQQSGFGAGHINVVVFTSGRGTPTGSAIMPTIKVSTNTPMYISIPDLIDLDAGTIADGIETLAEVGNRIFDEIVEVANGRLTKAELGGHHEFALSRMYKTKIQ